MEPLLLLLLTMMMMKTSADWSQNICLNSTTLRTQVACHSCSALLMMPCPAGFKRTPGSSSSGCKYHIRTASMKLAIKGCTFECYQEVQVKSCCPGFWGPDCVECPKHLDRPCSNRGFCSDGLGGNGTCTCLGGFAGTACEDCAPGRYGLTCRSDCSCVNGLCNSGLRGDGRCTCFSGYKGLHCDQEVPECAALRCPENSRCMEEALTGELACRCKPGFQNSGTQCLSQNPCLQPVCHAHATCVHTGPNQHLCACNEGYSGDGRVCAQVDPCQVNQGGCSESSICIYDGPGKSHCECILGFERLSDGTCKMKDACRVGSCHQNANCTTVGPDQVQCSCRQGYVGNGKVCYGNIMERLYKLNSEPGGKWIGQLGTAISLFGSLSWPLQNLGPFTVFVPINKGFRRVSVRSWTPSRTKYVAKNHLVAGMMPSVILKKTNVFYTLTGKSAESETEKNLPKIRVYGSRKRPLVLQADFVASNGMIHIINKVMDDVLASVDSNPDETLMKIISDNGKFQTFKSLLTEANLRSLLDLPEPITVFAPTTSAFNTMKKEHLQFFMSPEGHNKLVEFLRNHIVSTSLDIFNVVSMATIQTMANQILSINVTDNGQILVNGAPVREAAIEANNGRLYVMDGVLTPPSIEPLLPHRCDINETKIIQGKCVSCSQALSARCHPGVYTGSSTFGCLYLVSFNLSTIRIPRRGCSPACNTTVTTPACCKGFYGAECDPCPGGFQTPCSGHGQCLDGMAGNGSCVCEPNFSGSRCQYCSSPNKFGPNCDKTCPCVHGQCENRPDSDGQCVQDSCQSGFTGKLCDRQTRFCGTLTRFCHAHAVCDFTDGSGRCVCKPGFQGDGITCVESDPCAPPRRGGCNIHAKCIKTGPRSHICQCLRGWTADGDDCQPINNCHSPDRGGCHMNATCIYVGPGQSDCACKSGYKGDGRVCEAVNQCVTADGGCHYLASCLMLSSQWRCVCNDGYVGNGLLCYGSLAQELMELPDASDFYTWTAGSGLSEFLSDQNLTILVPTSTAISQMSTEDRTFWTMKGNLQSIIRNHLLSGIYPLSELRNMSSVSSLLHTVLSVRSGQEVTTVGGASIITSDLAATNGLIHFIDKVLAPERRQSEGLLAVLALRAEFSLFRSYLIDYNLTDEIEQAEAFTVFAPTDAAITEYLHGMAAPAMDPNTTRYHVVLSERLLKTDLSLGGYKETLLGFPFQLGIYPRDGQLFVNNALINSSNILCAKGVIHGLTEVLHITRNRCDKLTLQRMRGPCGYCSFHKNNLCPNGSKPDKMGKSIACLFNHYNEEENILMLGCAVICVKKKAEARCCEGFFGKHCEPCPGPKGQPCFGNGLCSDGINGLGLCQCEKGFNGTACELCQPGRYGVHCDQECKCQNGRCNEGPAGDGTCQCDVGWRGIYCDEKILSKADELCGAVKCHSSANCVIGTSGPQCLCAAGFQGNGTLCDIVNPCLVDNGGCSLNAACKRTQPGRRDCACNRGYTGDGFVCVEINPCLEQNGGCPANADCIHVGPNKQSCVCSEFYSGDGWNCSMIDLCKKKNGGCHLNARCNTTGPGTRSCTCHDNFIGDGLQCKGSVEKELRSRGLTDIFFGLMFSQIPLQGRGPFTVFVPKPNVPQSTVSLEVRFFAKNKEIYSNLLRNHIVMCHTLLPLELRRPQNLTSLSGLVLTTSSRQGMLTINGANVTSSDTVSANGIIHEIDDILFPPNINRDNIMNIPDQTELNLTDVAERHGYKTFYKLLEDTGLMDTVNNAINQPLTVFLPSDTVMASLPQRQKDFLFHQHNRPQLLEYLKYHIMVSQKVYAEGLIYVESGRTLQGSSLKFSCGSLGSIGEIFVDGSCRITQRHLVFKAGIAYGIDCLLVPPSLGGRCDEQSVFDVKMSCGSCSAYATQCPEGTTVKEVQTCDLPTMSISKNSGCQPICTLNLWQPKCCSGFYGRDCLVCPGGVHSPCSNHGTCDDGHFGNGTCTCEAGFQGLACEHCQDGFFGPSCRACNCSKHGSCDDGLRGTGLCFCEDGWTGELCDRVQTEVFQCSPSCSPKAVCNQNSTCVCRPFYEGDGYTCTVTDMCNIWNGGCAAEAKCSQKGEQVSCTCPNGYSGDGFTCLPVNPCTSGENGGCHEHATCTMTAPGKKKCSCKQNFIGDGVSCELKELPLSRCLQDNGGCHPEALCTDLHYEDSTLGVFHLRSSKGQYKLSYQEAQQRCAAEGATLATYIQLSYAQQGGLNLCSAGWLDSARVAYPTTFSNVNCGFGHVGIVDYGVRKNLSETWDAFCYRVKEVKCECGPGYTGDGFGCTGNLLQVLKSTPSFSNFLTQIFTYSRQSDGQKFLKRLTDPEVWSTLFVPDNSGLSENQSLSHRDLEIHLSEGQALPLSQLKNGTLIRTRVGVLKVLGVRDLLNPAALSSCYINERFVINADIPASNGVIHVLQAPLEAPPPPKQVAAAHQAGIGVVLLTVLVAGVIFVGFRFYKHKTGPFHFHYFKCFMKRKPPSFVPSRDNVLFSSRDPSPTHCALQQDEHMEGAENICNPVYDAAAAAPSNQLVDTHPVTDLLQDQNHSDPAEATVQQNPLNEVSLTQ